MRKEYWQLEVIFHGEDIEDYVELDGTEYQPFDELTPYDWWDILDEYFTKRFEFEFTNYDWKEVNDLVEDWVSFRNKGFVPFDIEGGLDMGNDSYSFYWIPKAKAREFAEMGAALGVGWYEANIGEIIYDSNYFYPEYLSDEAKKIFGYEEDED